jgi:peptide/nickel transport system substrate-binding protein
MEDRSRRGIRGARKFVIVFTALGLVAAACGSSKDDSSNTTTGNATNTTTAGPNTSVLTSTTAAPDTNQPTPGGTLTYALEAETNTGYSLIYSNCAISCWQVLRAIYDTVMAYDTNDKPQPYLAESVTHSDDYLTWNVKLRSGVKFHDGTDLNGQSLVTNIEAFRCSALTAPAWGEFGGCPFTYDASQPETTTNRKPVSTIIKDVGVDPADPQTAVVHFLLPAATFADTLAGLPVESPATLDLKDPTGTKAKNNPVGTGPFAFKEWTPNDHITLVKNATYWQNGLPYLDSIIFKPINDVSARENALRGGTVDMIMNFQGPSVAKFRAEKDKWSIFENIKGGDTGLIMLNHFPTYKGKDNPIADLRVRQALSLAIDYKEVLDLRQENVTSVANGPYTPGVPGYLADTGWPTQPDVAKAKSLIDAYKKEKGISGDLEIEFGTDADPFNRGTNELVATYFKEIGVNAVIDQTEQGQYITRALQGDFQMFGWRQYGGFNPDRNFLWWYSLLGTDPPGIGLNFSRYKSKVVDDNLTILRTNPDPAAQKTAAETINKQMAADVAEIWLSWNIWQFVAKPSVQNIGGGTLPDGTTAVEPSNGGPQHWMGQIWIKK